MTRDQTPRELLVIILDEPDRLQPVLQGLYEAHVPGATVLESWGGYTAHSWLEDIGLGGFARLFHQGESKQKTIMAVMDSALVEGAIAATEKAVEGFGRPHSGFLFSIPLSHTVGLHKRKQPDVVAEPVVSELDVRIRKMPVREASEHIESDLVIVQSNASLAEINREMLKAPSSHVAAVVSRENHLIGLVTLRQLADHVFFGIMPELFFSEVHDRERAEEFGRMTTVRSASDIMIDPVAVHADDPINEAFRLMHEHELSGLPMVNDSNNVVGFISLLELLELVQRQEFNYE